MTSVSDAASSGDSLKILYAMRDKIAEAIDGDRCPPRDLAPLMRRLQDICEKIDSLEERAKQEGSSDNATQDTAWDPTSI